MVVERMGETAGRVDGRAPDVPRFLPLYSHLLPLFHFLICRF